MLGLHAKQVERGPWQIALRRTEQHQHRREHLGRGEDVLDMRVGIGQPRMRPQPVEQRGVFAQIALQFADRALAAGQQIDGVLCRA